MANGDGLMSLATNPNLSLAEKFALGFLSGAEANQRERIKKEEEYVRKRVETIKDRVTKQSAKYTTLRKEKEDQIKMIRAVAPGATIEIIQGLVSQGEDAVKKFVEDARQDIKMFKDRDPGKLGKFLSYVGKDGRLKRGDSSLYVPHTADIKADELAKACSVKFNPKLPRMLKTIRWISAKSWALFSAQKHRQKISWSARKSSTSARRAMAALYPAMRWTLALHSKNTLRPAALRKVS